MIIAFLFAIVLCFLFIFSQLRKLREILVPLPPFSPFRQENELKLQQYLMKLLNDPCSIKVWSSSLGRLQVFRYKPVNILLKRVNPLYVSMVKLYDYQPMNLNKLMTASEEIAVQISVDQRLGDELTISIANYFAKHPEVKIDAKVATVSNILRGIALFKHSGCSFSMIDFSHPDFFPSTAKVGKLVQYNSNIVTIFLPQDLTGKLLFILDINAISVITSTLFRYLDENLMLYMNQLLNLKILGTTYCKSTQNYVKTSVSLLLIKLLDSMPRNLSQNTDNPIVMLASQWYRLTRESTMLGSTHGSLKVHLYAAKLGLVYYKIKFSLSKSFWRINPSSSLQFEILYTVTCMSLIIR